MVHESLLFLYFLFHSTAALLLDVVAFLEHLLQCAYKTLFDCDSMRYWNKQ